MSRRRWIANRWEGDRAYLTGGNAEHLARVLRARVGQEFEIAIDGSVRLGRIVSISDQQIEFELREALDLDRQGSVSLLLAVFKFDRMEWAMEKATELGVATIYPVICRRTDAHLAAAAAKRVDRWRRITREASQQSRRASEPEISEPSKLREVLALSAERRIVLSEVERERTLKDALSQSATADRGPATVLAVGPEGGWTEDELRGFSDAGWISASLGPTILRAETAAIAALAVTFSISG